MKSELKDIIKFKSEEEYISFVKDIETNLPKYKKALYSFYESNNESFPLQDFMHQDDLILIMFLNEYGYSHDTVLNVLDNFLIPKLNMMELFSFLSFLYGFDVINESEMNKRNIIKDVF